MDAGGMPLVWFDGVNADASVAWLSTLVTQPADGRPRVAENALVCNRAARGYRRVQGARAIRADRHDQMRGRSLSWLAQRAADEALPDHRRRARRTRRLEVKKQAVNALSRFPNQEGIPKLIEVARSHTNAEVRRQAMFGWASRRIHAPWISSPDSSSLKVRPKAQGLRAGPGMRQDRAKA